MSNKKNTFDFFYLVTGTENEKVSELRFESRGENPKFKIKSFSKESKVITPVKFAVFVLVSIAKQS